MFDQLEARLNRVAMAKLANATATIGANSVPVIFDAEYKQGMVGVIGMGASSPQMVISSADVPADFVDMVIGVDGASWTVADRQPDSRQPTGLTVVFLEKA